jgi:hypothetical protein
MGKLTITAGTYKPAKSAKQFDAVLTAWQRGEEVAWADLMTAWIKAPTAPKSKENILKLIGCLKRK